MIKHPTHLDLEYCYYTSTQIKQIDTLLAKLFKLYMYDFMLVQQELLGDGEVDEDICI